MHFFPYSSVGWLFFGPPCIRLCVRYRFRLVSKYLVEFNQLAIEAARGSHDMINRVMTKDNIGLAALLETQSPVWENGASLIDGIAMSWLPLFGNFSKTWRCQGVRQRLGQCQRIRVVMDALIVTLSIYVIQLNCSHLLEILLLTFSQSKFVWRPLQNMDCGA